MARRPPSWNRHRARFAGVPSSRVRTRRNGAWGFAILVCAVAALAFYLTLRWPSEAMLTAGDMPSAPSIAQAPIDRASLSCVVAHVTDGDTLRCQDGVRIRLHAVAARETDGTCSPGHPCPAASAEAATAELRRLVSGQTIRCEPIGQSYDRVTAICWTQAGTEINCAMVRSGTTLLWDRFDRQARLCRT